MESVREKGVFILSFLISLSVVYYYSFPLVSSEVPIGFDLAGHYTLTLYMQQLLSEWSVGSFDPLWLSGYPGFTFYPPVAYIFTAVLAVLLGGAETAFVFSLLLLPAAFILAFSFFVGRLYPAARSWSPLFSLIFLLSEEAVSFEIIGLHGLFPIGTYANYFALPMVLVFLGLMVRAASWQPVRWYIVSGVTLSIVFYTHSLSFFFLLFFLLSFSVFHWDARVVRSVFFVTVIAFFLSLPLGVDILRQLEFSSGVVRGVDRAQFLEIFFPRVSYESFSHVLSLFQQRSQIENFSVELLYSLPWGASLLIIGLFGLYSRVHSLAFRHFLLSILLLLPLFGSSFVQNSLGVPVHFYRFNQHLFILLSAAACIGVTLLMSSLAGTPRKALLSVLLIGFIFHALSFRIDNPNQSRIVAQDEQVASNRAELERVLAAIPSEARVLAPASIQNFIRLGSPALASYRLHQMGIESAPGLLPESSSSAPYVLPLMKLLQGRHAWDSQMHVGDMSLLEHPRANLSTDGAIRRLAMLGYSHVLSTSPSLSSRLAASPLVERLESRSFIELFRILDFRERVSSVERPLSVFAGGSFSDFERICQNWFLHPQLFEFPLAWLPAGLSELPSEYHSLLKVVLSQRSGDISGFNSPLAFTSVVEGGDWGGSELEDILSHLLASDSASPRSEHYAVFTRELGSLSVEGTGPRRLLYSFLPAWKAREESSRVFQLCPSEMLLLAGGAVELRFRRGLIW